MGERFEQCLLHGKGNWESFVDFNCSCRSQFSTLVCVFTLDRIGSRWTLYWGSVGQGIAMFLAGGFSYLCKQANAAGDTSKASSYGAAAASMVFIFTSVFGATWLSKSTRSFALSYGEDLKILTTLWQRFRGCILQKSSHSRFVPKEMHGV